VASVNFFCGFSSPLLLSNLRRLVASRHGAMQGKCETIKDLEEVVSKIESEEHPEAKS
jgi:hypothetical protein